jgi:serine/threonine-protein kinase
MPNSARVVVDVGTVIADTYKVEALIGVGGMGSVFLASHARLPGKQVAIKLLHAGLEEGDALGRFKREAEIASRLGHPNIVGVHDFNVLPDGTPYLVLEYLQGESLGARLKGGALPLDAVFSFARQIGSALAAAHREGIVHRDLKPANIFLVPTEIDGKLVDIAKVLDFGISKMRGSTTVKTLEFTLLGTPQYMSPEQAKGDHANVDQRADIFAFGSIVYEMLAGHPAFSGANIPEVCFKVVYEEPAPLVEEAPATPSHVIAAIQRAMAKEPADRFASVELFVEALTGRKLAQVSKTGISIAPPDDGPPSDAFAQTMNSGQFGIAVSTPPLRVPTPLPISEHTPQGATQVSIPPTPVPAPPPKRSLAPLVGIALGGAAIGALVIYLVTRGSSAPPPDAQVIAIVPPADSAPVLEPDAAVVVVDAAAIVDAAVIVDAAIAKPPRDAGRIAPVEPSGNDTAGPRGPGLQAAVTALASRDFDAADRLAGEVIVSDDATSSQRARARSIRATVACLFRFNEEQAALHLKAIPAGYRALRKQALDACHKAGYLEAFVD